MSWPVWSHMPLRQHLSFWFRSFTSSRRFTLRLKHRRPPAFLCSSRGIFIFSYCHWSVCTRLELHPLLEG
jgi:hypothetical protein